MTILFIYSISLWITFKYFIKPSFNKLYKQFKTINNSIKEIEDRLTQIEQESEDIKLHGRKFKNT